MELFLMVMLVSLVCLALTLFTFTAATRREDVPVPAKPVAAPAEPAPRFFGGPAATPPVALNAQMLEAATGALMLQLERHIRLERAAAEAFVEAPTAQSLHSRTTSPLVN